jgi:hypothetical protein
MRAGDLAQLQLAPCGPELHLPCAAGEAQRHLRMPVCDTPIEWQFATEAADSCISGRASRYASQRNSGTALHLGVGTNAFHVLQVAREAAAAITLVACSSGSEEHGSSGDDSCGCSLQIQHADDQWFQHWPDKLLRPIPKQELRAAVATALATTPAGAGNSIAGVWRRQRARLESRDKLAPGEVPEGMQEPLQPVRLVFSLLDGRGQPVAGFNQAAFEVAKQAARQAVAARMKTRGGGEAARLGPAEPVGPRRTRRRL